ncbi:MAG: recombinase family protein, partial [Pseudomonadota bacterium]
TIEIDSAALAAEAGIALDASTRSRLNHRRALTIAKRGHETKLVLGETIASAPDAALIALLAEAHEAMDALRTGNHPSIRALARALGRENRRVARSLPLAFLAPDIVEAIIEGRQPPSLTASTLLKLDDLPLSWPEQRCRLGFDGIPGA